MPTVKIYMIGSEMPFLHLGMSVLSNPRIGSTLLFIQNTKCVILEVMCGYGTLYDGISVFVLNNSWYCLVRLVT